MVRIMGRGSPTIVSISKPRACTSTETFPNDCREGREGRGVDGVRYGCGRDEVGECVGVK
jgi:hypothetical protein